MNCTYKNYLYIYDIKLFEKITLLIEKKQSKTTSKHIFCFICSKFFFINSTKHFF